MEFLIYTALTNTRAYLYLRIECMKTNRTKIRARVGALQAPIIADHLMWGIDRPVTVWPSHGKEYVYISFTTNAKGGSWFRSFVERMNSVGLRHSIIVD